MVEPLPIQQLAMGALLHNLTIFNHKQQVGILDGALTVSDD
jgi:hypothetical protein